MEEKKKQSADQTQLQQGNGKKRTGVLRLILRILTSVLTVLLIVMGVYMVIHRDRLNLDSIKRYLTYRALERSDEGVGKAFSIGQEENLCYAVLKDCLILSSGNRIQIYSDGGAQYEDIATSMAQPVIHVEGEYALVYDAGGKELYLFSDRQMTFHYTAQGSNTIITARVNARGWFAVVEDASGYKGTVTVYDSTHQAVVTERISSRFVMDAVVSADNRKLAVVTVGQEDANFVTNLNLYEVASGEQTDQRTYSNAPIMDLRWDESGLWLQQEYGVLRMDNRLSQVANWQNSTLYLRGFTLGGEGYAVEYFSRFRSGAQGQLVIIDGRGDVTGTLNVSGDILSLSAAGRYIAVLTSAKLTIYTSDFTEYASLPNTNGIKRALMRADGTALLVSDETASVFLP